VQTGLFALGCALTIGGPDGGGLVPKECWSGELGDATAYWLIRYISVAWIGKPYPTKATLFSRTFFASCCWKVSCARLKQFRCSMLALTRSYFKVRYGPQLLGSLPHCPPPFRPSLVAGMISFTAAMTWIIGCHQLFVVRVAWVKAKRRLVERGALPQRGAGGAAFEADTAGGQRA
jgi:hypothetical protein